MSRSKKTPHPVRRNIRFGSPRQARATSDIDVLVELGEEISLLHFVRIKFELEDLLGRKVDLVAYEAIKPRLKERILSEEIRIYGPQPNTIDMP